MLALTEFTRVAPYGVATRTKVRDRGLALTCAFAFLAYIQYVLVGWWLISVRHFMINDAMSRTLTAQLMVLSRDPHLANMGYYWMPLPMLVRIPFVLLLYPFHITAMAGPASSGIMAALTLPVIYLIGKTVGAPSVVTGLVIAVYAMSPITIFSAASGMSETTLGFFLSLTVLGYVKWVRFGGVQNLAYFGVALGAATLSRFETMLLIPIVVVVFALASPRGRRLPTVVLAVLPSAVAMGLFTFVSGLIKRDPLYWWHAAAGPTTTPSNAAWLPDEINTSSMVKYGVVMMAVMAPGAFAALAGALVDRRRFWPSLGLAGFVFIQPAVVVYQVIQGKSWATPRLFLYMAPLLAICTGLWLLRGPDTNIMGARDDLPIKPAGISLARLLGYLAIALTPVGVVVSTYYLADSDHSSAEGEYVLLQPLLGRVNAADPVDRNPSHPVFTLLLPDFERMLKDLDPELAKGKVVAMDSLQGFPLLFTSHPKQFLVPEDRDFERILSDPIGRFEYVFLLPDVDPSSSQVLISQALGYSGPLGKFELIKEYGVAKLYEWKPSANADPDAPTPPGAVPTPGR